MKTFVRLLPLVAIVFFAVYGSRAGYIQADKTFSVQQSDTTHPLTYIDLQSGDTLEIFFNKRENRVYNLKNRQPVAFYVNTRSGDTVYGRGRIVVNGYLQSVNGNWQWDTAKVKVDNDGSIKIKDAGRKIKIDEDEIKIKDGEMKLKRDSTKFKLKGPEGKIKRKEDKPLKVKPEDD